MKAKNYFKAIGPGLLFAGSSIGTSHLVLSTRAGANHGMIYLWIILAALLFKYPFFEFGARYTAATGHSLLKGYKEQGAWAIYSFLLVIVISMFAVTGAIGAVCAGLLSTIFSLSLISVPLLAIIIIMVTVAILLGGGYGSLDKVIKFISIVLFISVLIAFVAVLIKGPVSMVPTFEPQPLLEGVGLTLFIGLLGWMPTGIEASAMNSLWIIKNQQTKNAKNTMSEILFDFNLGYFFTIIMAILFLILGAFTLYGSGQQLDGGTTEFSTKLMKVISDNLGPWSYPLVAIGAFGTIYGTLITVLDGFTRALVGGLRALKYDDIVHGEEQSAYVNKMYRIFIIILGIGRACLFYFSSASMITMLDWATIISFLVAPLLAYLNIKVIRSIPAESEHKPHVFLLWLGYIGLILMICFTVYYLMNFSSGGH